MTSTAGLTASARATRGESTMRCNAMANAIIIITELNKFYKEKVNLYRINVEKLLHVGRNLFLVNF